MAGPAYTISYTGEGDFNITMPGIDLKGIVPHLQRLVGLSEVKCIGNGHAQKVIATPGTGAVPRVLVAQIAPICHRYMEGLA